MKNYSIKHNGYKVIEIPIHLNNGIKYSGWEIYKKDKYGMWRNIATYSNQQAMLHYIGLIH